MIVGGGVRGGGGEDGGRRVERAHTVLHAGGLASTNSFSVLTPFEFEIGRIMPPPTPTYCWGSNHPTLDTRFSSNSFVNTHEL